MSRLEDLCNTLNAIDHDINVMAQGLDRRAGTCGDAAPLPGTDRPEAPDRGEPDVGGVVELSSSDPEHKDVT